MANAMTSDEARELARARWGSHRTDRIVAELRDRADELGPSQIAALQALVDAASVISAKEEANE